MTKAETTRDHDEIRHWAEARSGRPTRVKGADEGGILRIDFGERDDHLDHGRSFSRYSITTDCFFSTRT